MLNMYPAIVNSPLTSLVRDIDDSQTTIEVTDASKLPDGPNIAVIGRGENAETIIYEAKSGNILTGVTRGFQGTARSWPYATEVARYFTAYDYDALRQNFVTHLNEDAKHRIIKFFEAYPTTNQLLDGEIGLFLDLYYFKDQFKEPNVDTELWTETDPDNLLTPSIDTENNKLVLDAYIDTPNLPIFKSAIQIKRSQSGIVHTIATLQDLVTSYRYALTAFREGEQNVLWLYFSKDVNEDFTIANVRYWDDTSTMQYFNGTSFVSSTSSAAAGLTLTDTYDFQMEVDADNTRWRAILKNISGGVTVFTTPWVLLANTINVSNGDWDYIPCVMVQTGGTPNTFNVKYIELSYEKVTV